MNDDNKELISLCASILADDEVTAEESYALAEWLNDHPAAAESWPGRELVGPLKEVWSDGVVSPRELQRLARLLGGLEREWTRRSAPSDTHRKVKLVDFARALGKTPLVPRIAANMDILSWDEPDVTYRVNLRGPSCTCPEWLEWKSRLPAGHLGRCCKHIFDAYAQLPRGHAGAAWLMAFLDLGRPTSASIKWKLLDLDSDPVLISSANKKGWANVFAKDGSEYARYGYNVEECRWSYRIEPDSASTIAEEIVALSKANVGRSSAVPAANSRPARSGESRIAFGWRVLGVAGAAAAVAFGFVTFRSQIVPEVSALLDRKPAASASSHWTTRTVRNVQIETAGRGTVIPQGTELRVIGRTPTEVMVSYAGATLTIPISDTDLK